MNGFQTPDGKKSQAGEAGSNAKDGLEWEFLVGTAISVYQNSGGDNNNWWRYERQRTRFGKPTIDVSRHFIHLLAQLLWSLLAVHLRAMEQVCRVRLFHSVLILCYGFDIVAITCLCICSGARSVSRATTSGRTLRRMLPGWRP